MNNEIEWLEIGTIVAPQGLRGELRVYPNSDFPERFIKPGIRWLQNPQTKEIEEVNLVKGRYIPGKNLYVISLEDILYRDEAEELRDYKLLVPESDRLELEEDEYHVRDLINTQVFDRQTGELVGEVIDIFYAGNTLLQVKLERQPIQEEIVEKDLSQISRRSKRKKFKKQKKSELACVLIPFVTEIVPIVDINNKRLEINPPDGLL